MMGLVGIEDNEWFKYHEDINVEESEGKSLIKQPIHRMSEGRGTVAQYIIEICTAQKLYKS